MASAAPDYFSGRPTARTRPSAATLQAGASPRSPRTPLLGRSISSQFGSPGSFVREQEECLVFELGARHLSAGYAGESRPRVVLKFDPDSGRRVGDYRQHDPSFHQRSQKLSREEDWGADHSLYSHNLRQLDLGLVEAKLERAVRRIHSEHLQLDQKSRKVVLALPSLLPTPLLEIILKVLFTHYSQPPSVQILTAPVLSCVSAGLRNAFVIDIGWEETVFTAVGEYKEVHQKRSVRAGKLLTREYAKLLHIENTRQNGLEMPKAEARISFPFTEEVMQRMGWCRSRFTAIPEGKDAVVKIPWPDSGGFTSLEMPFNRLAEPVDEALFASASPAEAQDEHELPLALLAYRVLLALPVDLRAACLSRIVITGGVAAMPGLKRRLLQEIQHLLETRGWDPVRSYGSASSHHEDVLKERSANIALRLRPPDSSHQSQPGRKAGQQDELPARDRVHDDINDPISSKAERHARNTESKREKAGVRGVETVGAWAGASLTASLRVKGVHEIEREEWLKHGYRDSGQPL